MAIAKALRYPGAMPSLFVLAFLACKTPSDTDPSDTDPSDTDPSDTDPSDTDSGDTDGGDTDIDDLPGDPWADAVISFEPGENAGYGQDRMPDVVLGAPHGGGGASTDVVSLGREGVIVLDLFDRPLTDGPGPDLVVFENPFVGWYETGVVAVSVDGVEFVEWPCDSADTEGGYPGCAGVALVAASEGGVDATDPSVSGGDLFDLADIGVAGARYVRIRDSGANPYDGNAGGFDLDGVAVINGVAP